MYRATLLGSTEQMGCIQLLFFTLAVDTLVVFQGWYWLHAWLWRVAGKTGVNAYVLARLGLLWRGQWVCDVGG